MRLQVCVYVCMCVCVCVCVCVDCVGFISDVFAIVVQISDVKRSKLAIFKTFQLRTWLQIYMYSTV